MYWQALFRGGKIKLPERTPEERQQLFDDLGETIEKLKKVKIKLVLGDDYGKNRRSERHT